MTTTKERRTWGTGRLFRRKTSRFWYIRYYDASGKRRTEATHTESRADAERILRDRLARKDRGELAPNARKVTFGDLATLLLDDYRVKRRRSWRRAEDALAQLAAFYGGRCERDDADDPRSRVRRYVGGCRATQIGERWQAYVAERLEAGAAHATLAIERAALRRAFTIAVRAGRLAQAPHLESLGKLNNARQGFFEADDFDAVLDALPDYLRAPMQFAYFTGWRVQSEVLPLTWAQVDLDAGMARLEPGTTKNDEGRAFPIGALPALQELVEAQREQTTALEKATGVIVPWVFHRDGKPIKSYRRAWATACDRAAHGGKPRSEKRRVVTRPQLVGRIVHDLRRTAVRNLERAGVPRSVAMKLTGHKTESVYRRYAIVAEADLREGVGKLANLKPRVARDVLPFRARCVAER